MVYAQENHFNFRIQQSVVQIKRAQLTAFLRALEYVANESTGPWDEQNSENLMREFSVMKGNIDNGIDFPDEMGSGEIQYGNQSLEVQSAKMRVNYLNEIFRVLKPQKEVKKSKRAAAGGFLKRKLSMIKGKDFKD